LLLRQHRKTTTVSLRQKAAVDVAEDTEGTTTMVGLEVTVEAIVLGLEVVTANMVASGEVTENMVASEEVTESMVDSEEVTANMVASGEVIVSVADIVGSEVAIGVAIEVATGVVSRCFECLMKLTLFRLPGQ
jgi:hypothetical protein